MTRHFLAVAITSAALALAVDAAVVGTPGCTPIVRQDVLTAEQDACMVLTLGSSVIPIGTDPTLVAADVKVACSLVEGVTSYVESVVAAYMGGQAEAGIAPPAAAGPYLPSPRVLARRGIVIVSHDAGVR